MKTSKSTFDVVLRRLAYAIRSAKKASKLPRPRKETTPARPYRLPEFLSMMKTRERFRKESPEETQASKRSRRRRPGRDARAKLREQGKYKTAGGEIVSLTSRRAEIAQANSSKVVERHTCPYPVELRCKVQNNHRSLMVKGAEGPASDRWIGEGALSDAESRGAVVEGGYCGYQDPAYPAGLRNQAHRFLDREVEREAALDRYWIGFVRLLLARRRRIG